MARVLAQRGLVGQRVEQLPATYWTQFTTVRCPGRPDRRIDEIVVGPSGISVVLNLPGHPPATGASTCGWADLEEAARRASAAAEAVADLLPDRYRGAVTPAVCLTDTLDVGFSVGAVFAASPSVLRHASRHQPRVLSTSEADAMAHRLRATLEPFPVEPPASPAAAWWRWRRLWLAGAAVATGVGAALAAGATPPWAQP
jgi:hypothetical protein